MTDIYKGTYREVRCHKHIFCIRKEGRMEMAYKIAEQIATYRSGAKDHDCVKTDG